MFPPRLKEKVGKELEIIPITGILLPLKPKGVFDIIFKWYFNICLIVKESLVFLWI